MHVHVKTILEFIATFCAKELGFSAMHLENVLLQIRVYFEAEATHRTETVDELGMVARDVFLEIILGRETHSTTLTLVTNAEKMVGVKMFLRVNLLVKDNVTVPAFKGVVSRNARNLK